jgi:hypothetical protein
MRRRRSIRRQDGRSGCSSKEPAYSTGPDGGFVVALDPGACVVRASHAGQTSQPVLAIVAQDHETPVNLVVP